MPILDLPDGRRLDYVTSGADDGPLVVLQHGTPSVAHLWSALTAPSQAAGLRLAAASRPGYGQSTSRLGRSVANIAADVAALADHLEAGRFATVGWSGGGPHALATAAVLGDRVAAVATVGGVAPYHADGLDWLAGMGQGNLDEFGAAAAGADTLTSYLDAAAAELATVTAEQLVEQMATLLPPADRAAVSGPLGEELAASFRASVASGVDGWRDDDLAFVAPWGVDLDAVTAPAAIWHGTTDLMVPAEHARWLAAHVPGADLHLEEGAGHVSVLVDHGAEIVEWLSARF